MKCKTCEGEGYILCGHESHYISSMSTCNDCDNGNIPCPECIIRKFKLKKLLED